jgi:hypothetical protein
VKACLLALLVLAAKWVLIERFAGQAPFADQWDAEGETIYAPMLRGEWTWDRLFSPWNEHRIVPSRLLSILLFRLTGQQWDPTVELAISALLHAVVLGVLGGWLMRQSSAIWHPRICLFVVMLGILPFAYENTLWSFQSSFYCLLLFSLLCGWGLLGSSPNKIRWWVGLFAGCVAVFALGSGGLVGAAILPVLTMRTLKRKRITLTDLATALAAVALMLMVWVIRVDVAAHVKLAPGSWADFCVAAWRMLAWPFSSFILVAFVVWMPVAIFVFRLIHNQSSRLAPLSDAILFLAGWAVLQMMAIAWVRGALLESAPPSSRYLDIMTIGLVANLAAIISLTSRIKPPERWLRLIASVWAFVVAAGLIDLSARVATNLLGQWRQASRVETDRLALYLRVGDEEALKVAQRWDRAAALVKTWSGSLARALPPALQARPPQGFRFLPAVDWEEGGFDPRLGVPGGYAAWGNGAEENSRAGPLDVTSTPFVLSRGAVAFSYAMSSRRGRCLLEFLSNDGSIAATYSMVPSMEGKRSWWEGTLRIPPGEYRLRVFGHRESGSVAVTAPREMSLAGFIVRICLGFGGWLFVGAGVGLVIVLSIPSHATSAEK